MVEGLPCPPSSPSKTSISGKVLDISLAKKYGWKPKVSLDEGFNITYKDFLKNKNRT